MTVGQIRELLQRRVLLAPIAVEGRGPAILHLTDSGAVVEIPVPSRRPRGEPNRGAKGRRRTTTERARTSEGDAPNGGIRPGRRLR